MPSRIKAEFAAAMARFGPFTRIPHLAVGVSGGADSTALAVLAHDWARQRAGRITALIIDHGLRRGSDVEAKITRQRLEACGIAARIIALTGIGRSRVQETARLARHAALAKATRDAGALFLLLGHHAADQSETVAMRAERGNCGLEGMAEWTARNDAVLLRPLLAIAPVRLRAFLNEERVPWLEDPSNQDLRFERVRMRLAGTSAVPDSPKRRQQSETASAMFLARHAVIRPEGFAIIMADTLPAAALGSLLRTIGGAFYAPKQQAVAVLASGLRSVTLGGVRVLKAGRLGHGWLLVREAASCALAIPAAQNSIWDRRFRLCNTVMKGNCGAVGRETATFRDISNLPAAVLASLPCIRVSGDRDAKPQFARVFLTPHAPAAALPFQAPDFRPLSV